MQNGGYRARHAQEIDVTQGHLRVAVVATVRAGIMADTMISWQ
jgi:hypothetical protein